MGFLVSSSGDLWRRTKANSCSATGTATGGRPPKRRWKSPRRSDFYESGGDPWAVWSHAKSASVAKSRRDVFQLAAEGILLFTDQDLEPGVSDGHGSEARQERSMPGQMSQEVVTLNARPSGYESLAADDEDCTVCGKCINQLDRHPLYFLFEVQESKEVDYKGLEWMCLLPSDPPDLCLLSPAPAPLERKKKLSTFLNSMGKSDDKAKPTQSVSQHGAPESPCLTGLQMRVQCTAIPKHRLSC